MRKNASLYVFIHLDGLEDVSFPINRNKEGNVVMGIRDGNNDVGSMFMSDSHLRELHNSIENFLTAGGVNESQRV